ncbi:MAG: hypothetical protein O3B41_02555 [Bacteroidetes bacterium]|nr:hypothetical protein [Bacteroidota bacterium]
MNHEPNTFSLAELLADSRMTVSWPDDVNLELIPGELLEELASMGSLEIPFVGRFEKSGETTLFFPDPALIVALNASFETLPVLTVAPGGNVVLDDSLGKSDETVLDSSGPDPSQVQKIDVIPEIELQRPTTYGPELESTTAESGTGAKKESQEIQKPVRSASRRTVHHQPKRGSSKTAWLIVAGIAVIAIAVLLLRPYLFGPTPQETPTSMASPPDVLSDSNSVALQPDSTKVVDVDSSGIALGSPTTSEAKTTTVSTDAIKTITSETKGYTIIVRSALSASAAESIRSELATLNFPMGVLVGKSDGVVRYRMALGVFKSTLQADSVRDSLGSRLPEGSWSTRIR